MDESKSKWEEMPKMPSKEFSGLVSYRLPVPGGWLIRTFYMSLMSYRVGVVISETFLADDKHSWKLTDNFVAD